jgi:hypothetical protein
MDVQPLAAGGFSAWLAGMQRALGGDGGSDVPCDGCTACCRSSQFVHIAPDETETLAHIPRPLLFPAPRLPRGNVLLGYDENGHCPMLVDDRCSIYEHRPRACRTYDCRVLAAAGLALDDDVPPPIARQAGRWRFAFPSDTDHVQHEALGAAATFLQEHEELLIEAAVPRNPTQRAVLAVRLHDRFSGHDPDPAAIRALLASRPRPS